MPARLYTVEDCATPLGDGAAFYTTDKSLLSPFMSEKGADPAPSNYILRAMRDEEFCLTFMENGNLEPIRILVDSIYLDSVLSSLNVGEARSLYDLLVSAISGGLETVFVMRSDSVARRLLAQSVKALAVHNVEVIVV